VINKAELLRLKNTPIYSRKDINRILRTNFFVKNTHYNKPQYSFAKLETCFWSICREQKKLVFEEQVEKIDNEVYAIYPTKDKTIWCSILHKFGNLCFAQTNLPVDVVFEQLRFDDVSTVSAEYGVVESVLRKLVGEHCDKALAMSEANK
jgi:hypothetical protein